MSSNVHVRTSLVAALRDIRIRAAGPEPKPGTPEPTPNQPEITEPKRYPIHPDIPQQPIHEPLKEPTQTPVEGP